jgi:hypothetical protein
METTKIRNNKGKRGSKEEDEETGEERRRTGSKDGHS